MAWRDRSGVFRLRVTVEMTSLLGCAGEEFASILSALGYRVRRTPKAPAVVEGAAEAPAEALLETGETPWQAAVRETREETGITVARPGPLLLAHFLLPDATWPLSRFGLVFDGGTLSTGELDAITLDAHEHCEWDVRSLQEWEKELHPASFACLAAVDRARRTGTAGYLDRHT